MLTKRLEAGDLLTARTGYPGTTCLVPDKYKGAQSFTTLITRPKKGKVKSEYLNYFINSEVGQRFFTTNQIGGAQKNVNASSLRSMLVFYPPKVEEQACIAQVLSDIDELIELLNKLIEKKKNVKHGAMQELLTGKRRLLGFKGEWKIKKLSEIFVLTSGKTKSKFLENDGKYVVMDMGSVSTEGKNISIKTTNHLEDLLEYGDLVMPKDDIGGGNIIGKLAFIEKNNKYVLGDHVYKLKAINPKTNTLFYSYLVNNNHTNAELRKKAAGSAQLGLNRKDVENQEVKTTMDTMEQLAIAQVLLNIDSEIEGLEQKREKYKQLKTGMMQQLLTGRIRLEWKN